MPKTVIRRILNRAAKPFLLFLNLLQVTVDTCIPLMAKKKFKLIKESNKFPHQFYGAMTGIRTDKIQNTETGETRDLFYRVGQTRGEAISAGQFEPQARNKQTSSPRSDEYYDISENSETDNEPFGSLIAVWIIVFPIGLGVALPSYILKWMIIGRKGYGIPQYRTLGEKIGLRIWYIFLGFICFSIGLEFCLGVQDLLSDLSRQLNSGLPHRDFVGMFMSMLLIVSVVLWGAVLILLAAKLVFVGRVYAKQKI